MNDAGLTHEEIARYARHLVLPEVGLDGQRKLKNARVLCVGTGGLGSPALLYLAAAGVGTIGIVDFDRVDESNLQRQIVHGTSRIGTSKVESAAGRLADLNPHVVINRHDVLLESANAVEIFAGYDLVIDGTDNFPARYLVNDCAFLTGIPDVYGSIHRFEGQVSVFDSAKTGCYRCLHPEPPPPGSVPDCEEAGVLGVIPGLIGTIQALEAIKWMLNLGETLAGRLLIVDGRSMTTRQILLRRDPGCPLCGDAPTILEPIDYDAFCGTQRTALSESEEKMTDSIDVRGLKERMEREDGSFVLVDVREPHEREISRIPDAVPIPLGELRDRVGELDNSKEIIVHCRSGKRSAMAANFLRNQGFRATNLEGGVLAWSDEIDPSQPKY